MIAVFCVNAESRAKKIVSFFLHCTKRHKYEKKYVDGRTKNVTPFRHFVSCSACVCLLCVSARVGGAIGQQIIGNISLEMLRDFKASALEFCQFS